MPKITHQTSNLKRVTLNLPKHLYAKIDTQAEESGITITELIRSASILIMHLGSMGVHDVITVLHDNKERDVLLPFDLNPAINVDQAKSELGLS